MWRIISAYSFVSCILRRFIIIFIAFKALSKLALQRGDLTTANSFSIQAVQADEDFRSWSDGISSIAQKIQNGRTNIQKRMYDDAIKEYSD